MPATNGIIYVIDKVIIPPEAGSDIAQVLEKKGGFSTLLTAIKVAGLTDTIKSGNYSINHLKFPELFLVYNILIFN